MKISKHWPRHLRKDQVSPPSLALAEITSTGCLTRPLQSLLQLQSTKSVVKMKFGESAARSGQSRRVHKLAQPPFQK